MADSEAANQSIWSAALKNATGPRTAFLRFARPLTATGLAVNAFVFLISMFGYMLFFHAWSLRAIAIGLGVLAVVMSSMGVLVPLAAKRASAGFYRILERQPGSRLTADDLKIVRNTLLLIPWRTAAASVLGWLIVIPGLTVLFFRLFGEPINWLELEVIALAVTPITFTATLLGQDQVLLPFVKFYFPAAGTQEYGSLLVLTDAKRTLLFNFAFAVYPLVLLVLLGINAINSSHTIAEASRRFSEIAIYAVVFLVMLLVFLSGWRFRKVTAKQLLDGEGAFESEPAAGGAAEPLAVQENLVGTVLDGKYLLQEVLGRGGMAVVYKARHVVTARPVAVKILAAAFARELESIKRFRQEAKAAVAVRHANIVDVYDCGATGSGILYLVMDFIDGKSLAHFCSDGTLGAEDILKIMRQTGEALAHAHANNVIHRDVKPGNIMIVTGEDGSVSAKVVDFGIAKVKPADSEAATRLTQTGQVFGSPAYMSPEQCQGKDLDLRSDIYSLGCVFYELLSGAPPFASEGFVCLAFQHIHDAPPPLNLKADLRASFSKQSVSALEKIVEKCLQKQPSERYQNLCQFLKDLYACSVDG
jgi:tRNA A-37 threonylcarbamoyl transferase component Bud32